MPTRLFYHKTPVIKTQNSTMMKRYYLLLSLAAGLSVISSCRRDYIYGDITPNTDRVIVEFFDGKNAKDVAMDYATGVIKVDVAQLQFMVRSTVNSNATVKVVGDPTIVSDYNTANGTSYTPVPGGLFALDPSDIELTPSERKKNVSIRINPGNVATGEWAVGLKIVSTTQGEISQTSSRIVVVLHVKNKYDGKYHLKGFYTRTDNPAYNGPFETDIEMITTGPNSVAMYWPDFGDFYQPFSNAGSLTAFSNVAPEAFFNAGDQVTSINNFTGDPVAGPFMTPSPGANSRFVPGATPVIYLKYYYNTNPANRIFADTLIYTGSR
jgi:hypothetical protein